MFIRQSDPWNLRRVSVAWICAFHVAAAIALGPADVVLDADRAATPVHIEPQGHEDCAFGHGHLFCQLVRSLSRAGISNGIHVANPPAPLVRPSATSREATHVRSTPIMAGSVIPRGPPTL